MVSDMTIHHMPAALLQVCMISCPACSTVSLTACTLAHTLNLKGTG